MNKKHKLQNTQFSSKVGFTEELPAHTLDSSNTETCARWRTGTLLSSPAVTPQVPKATCFEQKKADHAPLSVFNISAFST